LYGTKHATEKIRRSVFKNLVDFSLSLSFDDDDSDKLLLKLDRRASFTSFDLVLRFVRRTLLLLCVLSLSRRWCAQGRGKSVFSMPQSLKIPFFERREEKSTFFLFFFLARTTNSSRENRQKTTESTLSLTSLSQKKRIIT